MKRLLTPNSISLISLMIAIAALSLSVWRNEQTEYNRNVRYAGYETLKAISETQKIVHFAFYANNEEIGNPISAWAYINLIEDFSHTLPKPAQKQAQILKKTWAQHWDKASKNKLSNEAVIKALDNLRQEIVITLNELT